MTNGTRHGIIVSAFIGLVVGVAIAIVAFIIGGIHQLSDLRTYNDGIGTVAGILTFLSYWLGLTI